MNAAEKIARYYGQGKEVRNRDGWLTLCVIHQESHPSLSITDTEDGDVKVHCHVGCDFKEIKDRFRADGLLPEWKPSSEKNGKKQAPPTPEKKDHPPEPEKPSYVWKKSSREGIEHGQQYLANRGIFLDPMPPCFKWNSYKDETMLVCAVTSPQDTQVYAVHRLPIDIDTHLKSSKGKLLGLTDGRGIWFDRKGDMKTLIIGEGPETTLSAMQVMKMNGVSAISANFLEHIILPDDTEAIYILVDSDRNEEPKKMTGQKAAYSLAKRFTESRDGRVAYLVSPDDTCFSDTPVYLDFNDLLQADPTGESIRQRFTMAIRFQDLEWRPQEGERENKKEDDVNNYEIFNRFVFLATENKIIDTVGHDIKDSMMVKDAFIVSQAGKFHHYIDENGKEKNIPLAQYWLMSDKKKTAAALKYSPGKTQLFINGDGRTYYNVFRFPYQSALKIPEKECIERLRPWGKIMDTVFHRHRGYIEDWFAYTVQHPEKRTGIMPICISEVGLGKSLVMSIMGKVVGPQNFSNGKILDVTGLGKSGTQWGDWIFNKKVACIEEIDPEGETGVRYRILDALKDIITNETLALNLKGGRNGTFPVFANIMGFSNHRDCIKIPFGDRRLFIVDSTGQPMLSKEEYGEIVDWANDENNIIAVFQYLSSREINKEFHPGQAKMTKAKERLQRDGRSLMQMAFDLVISDFPCDLLTTGELQLAVCQALHYLEGHEGIMEARNLNADRQYNLLVNSLTTLVCGGQRIRAMRATELQKGGADWVKLGRSTVRALRNGSKWADQETSKIKEAMLVIIPHRWIKEEAEENFSLF